MATPSSVSTWRTMAVGRGTDTFDFREQIRRAQGPNESSDFLSL
jgi:hypothetical protein